MCGVSSFSSVLVQLLAMARVSSAVQNNAKCFILCCLCFVVGAFCASIFFAKCGYENTTPWGKFHSVGAFILRLMLLICCAVGCNSYLKAQRRAAMYCRPGFTNEASAKLNRLSHFRVSSSVCFLSLKGFCSTTFQME